MKRAAILLAVLLGLPPATAAQVGAPLEVSIPKEGAVWRAGETRAIRWETGPGETVRIRLAPTGNGVFFVLEEDAPNTGEFVWRVDNVTTGRARIFITDSTTGLDSWSGRFTILNIPTAESVGELYFRSQEGGDRAWLRAAPFTEFTWYLITDIDFTQTGFDQSVAAWAASVEIPAQITITQTRQFPDRAFNASNLDHNWVVGLGECLEADRMPFTLLEYRGILFEAAADLVVRLGPPTPGFLTPPDAPLWAGCGVGSGDWPYPAVGSFTINPTTVGTAPRSWGQVKSSY